MKLRKKPEPLTVAYMAIGAHTALVKLQSDDPAAHAALIEESSGQLGVIDNVISFALLADNIGDRLTHNTCWSYEVAEVFGGKLVDMLRVRWPEMDIAANALSEILIAAEYDVDEVVDAIGRYLASPK